MSDSQRTIVRIVLGVVATVMIALLIDPDAPPPGPPPVIAATLVSATGAVEVDGRAPDPGDEIFTGAIIRSGTGGAVALRMADGVEIRLEASTQLAFPGTAIVMLTRGGVHFDTAGRKNGMPIEVRTAIGTARDIGTSFEVHMTDTVMRVLVREGVVQVDSGGATARVERDTELTTTGNGTLSTRPMN